MRRATSSSSEVLRRCGPLWGIGAFITGGSVASVASRIEGVKMSKPKNKTNADLVDLIDQLKAKSRDTGAALWRR